MNRFDVALTFLAGLALGAGCYHYGYARSANRDLAQQLEQNLIQRFDADLDERLNRGGLVFSVDWVSGALPERKPLLDHLRDDPNARGLEIGSFEGRSAIWFAENILTHPSATLTCIDPFPGQLSRVFDHNIETAGISAKVKKVTGFSQEALRAMEPNQFDFAYLDGCHLTTCALEDMVLTWPLLKEGGIMIVDDYDYIGDNPEENPRPAINAFIDIYSHAIEMLLRGDRQVALRKVRELNRSEIAE